MNDFGTAKAFFAANYRIAREQNDYGKAKQH